MPPRRTPNKKHSPSRRQPDARSRPRPRKPASLLLRLAPAQLACLDALRASLRAAGAPPFSRRQIALALIDSTLGRRFPFENVRTLEQLRVALGSLDLSAIEKQLRERPRIDANVLDALEDTLK